MKNETIIRDEASADTEAIAEVTIAAFETLPISNHTEQFIIAALRATNLGPWELGDNDHQGGESATAGA